MANLREIRTRIASVSSISQITSAMKMVAAAKLRKSQDAVVQLRPYANKLSEIITAIGDSLKDSNEDNPYVNQREPVKVLLVVMTSNKGLCGAFNSSAIKKAVLVAYEKYGSQMEKNNVDFFLIGKKGEDFFKRRKFSIAGSRNDIYDHLNHDNAASIAEEIMEKFTSGKYDRVELIYNQFKNAAYQARRAGRPQGESATLPV
jgi:F-type H+-transporting ATPase subunit gamma